MKGETQRINMKKDIIKKITNSDVVKIILLPLLHNWSKWQLEAVPSKAPLLLPSPNYIKKKDE